MSSGFSKNIVSITDIIENKVRKAKELEFYDSTVGGFKKKEVLDRKRIQMAEYIIQAVNAEITPKAFIRH